MNEDLFSQLFELFNQPGPVNWRLAAEIAHHLAGERRPIDPWLAEEYQDLARLAALRLGDRLPTVTASDLEPADPRGWADANLQAYRYLAEPMAELFSASAAAGPLGDALRPLGPALLGMQAGVMVGFLSQTALGTFDVTLPTAEPSPPRLIVANVEGFAKAHGLDQRQVRLWAAMREVAFGAVYDAGWTRPRFLEMVERYIAGLELNPEALTNRLQIFEDPEKMQEMMSDPVGLGGLISAEERRPELEALQAFVAVVDGYATYVVEQLGGPMLPDLGRIEEAMRRRQAEPAHGEQLLNRMLGIEVRPEQVGLGAEFCSEVTRRWGDDALLELWTDPDHLPSLAELSDPVGWAARVLLTNL